MMLPRPYMLPPIALPIHPRTHCCGAVRVCPWSSAVVVVALGSGQETSSDSLLVQTFVPYNSPYTLPIPANARPTAVTTAPGINYPDVSSGGLMTLANATTNFALRFVGVSPAMSAEILSALSGLLATVRLNVCVAVHVSVVAGPSCCMPRVHTVAWQPRG